MVHQGTHICIRYRSKLRVVEYVLGNRFERVVVNFRRGRNVVDNIVLCQGAAFNLLAKYRRQLLELFGSTDNKRSNARVELYRTTFLHKVLQVRLTRDLIGNIPTVLVTEAICERAVKLRVLFGKLPKLGFVSRSTRLTRSIGIRRSLGVKSFKLITPSLLEPIIVFGRRSTKSIGVKDY